MVGMILLGGLSRVYVQIMLVFPVDASPTRMTILNLLYSSAHPFLPRRLRIAQYSINSNKIAKNTRIQIYNIQGSQIIRVVIIMTPESNTSIQRSEVKKSGESSLYFKVTVVLLLLLIVGLLAYIGYRVERLQDPHIEMLKQIKILNNTVSILQAKLLNETNSASILQTSIFESINKISQKQRISQASTRSIEDSKKRERAKIFEKLSEIKNILKKEIPQTNYALALLNKTTAQKQEFTQKLYEKLKEFQSYLTTALQGMQRMLEPLTRIKNWF